MLRKQNIRRLALVIALFALALTVGTVFALPDAATPPQPAHRPADIRAQSAAPQSPATVPYTTLVDVQTVDPQTLDPHWLYDTASGRVVAQVYETLLMHRSDDPAAHVPLLASAWLTSSDARTFTFTLRSGVTFHQGGSLEAHDVAYSFWRGLIQDRLDGPMWMWFEVLFEDAWTIDGLPGDDLAKCQAVKDAITYQDTAGTVTFHLASPSAPFLDLLATPAGAILDQEWMAASGGWGGSCADWRTYHDPPAEGSILYNQMNGTGPFRLEHWTAGEVKLVSYDSYWRIDPPWPEGPSGPAALETVLLKTVPTWETRRDMLLGGEADLVAVPGTGFSDLQPYVWAIHQGAEDREPLLTNPVTGTLRLLKDLPGASQTPLMFCYDINPDTNPYIGSGTLDGSGIPLDFFADIHVRRAFNYAMDWSTVISDAYSGEAIRSLGPIPKDLLGYTSTQPTYAYSPTLSAQEFQQAWGGQVWSQGFSLTLAYNQDNYVRQRFVQVLAQNLEAINGIFRAKVISMTWPAYLDARRSRRLPAYVGGWLEDYHHPHNWVHPFLHSQGAYGGYQSFPETLASQLDDKIEACVRLADPAAAETCYQELQNLSYANAAALWGVQGLRRHYERTEVRGRYDHPAHPPYYYALSKGPPPSTATVSQEQSTTVTFTHTSETSTTLQVPAGAVSETSDIVFTPDIAVEESHPGGFRLAGLTFDLQVCQGGQCLDDYPFAHPVTVTLRYSDTDVIGLIEDELYLYTWNGSAWVEAVTDCGWPLTAYQRYPDENRLAVPLCHFSRFALVGDTHSIYLPLVLKQK